MLKKKSAIQKSHDETRARGMTWGFGILPNVFLLGCVFILTAFGLSVYNKCMSKMGRPKKPAKDRQSRVIALRVTPAEYKKIERRRASQRLVITSANV